MRIDELQERREACRQRAMEIAVEVGTDRISPELQRELDATIEEAHSLELQIRERRHQEQRIRELMAAGNTTTGYDPGPQRIERPVDLDQRQTAALRTISRHYDDGTVGERQALRLDALVRRDTLGIESRYLQAIAHPAYRSAFSRLIGRGLAGGQSGIMAAQSELEPEEQAALAEVGNVQMERAALGISSGPIGGYAVPFTLDPSVLSTSPGAVNPIRQVARVALITSAEWRGVVSEGVTSSYVAEGTEADDNAPTLSQPVGYAERAQSFIPYSIEVGADWTTLEAEMTRLLGDAKNELECDRFIHGIGHSADEPEGLLTAGTSVVTTGGTATLAASDIYALKASLEPRYVGNASFLGNATSYDRVRQLTGPGSEQGPVWLDEPPSLLRRPAYECSAYPAELTSGSSIISFGDFSRFLVLDRVGMQVEVVQHLLGSNRRPLGMRGLYCYWRSGSKLLTPGAVKTLKVL